MNKDMPVNRNAISELIENELLWNLVSKNDFEGIMNLLSEKNISQDNWAAVLLALSKQAFIWKQETSANNIIHFITNSIEGKPEAPLLLRQIGDIYAFASFYEQARKYYGMLPITFQNIKLCFQTVLPNLDILELFSMRDQILSNIPEQHHIQIHSMVDDIMVMMATIPEVRDSHHYRYKKNLEYLKQIWPFNTDASLLDSLADAEAILPQKQMVVAINNTVCIKRNDVWHCILIDKEAKTADKQTLNSKENIMIHCISLESLINLIESAYTPQPDFFKYECYVILDFNLLQCIICVYDIAPIVSCNFIIRFIDKGDLKLQLAHFFIQKKKSIPKKAIYLTHDDPAFFSENVSPIIKKFQNEVSNSLIQLRQKASDLFPDGYYENVVQRIASGMNLRIFFLTSRYSSYIQFSIRDMAEGFQQLGHQVLVLKEDDDAGYALRGDLVLEKIINFQPDIIFVIDHFRFEAPLIPKNIPFVTWVQDVMPEMVQLKDPALITKYDHIFSFTQRLLDTFLDNKPIFENKKNHLLPISCSCQVYYPITQIEKKYDVTYVGHLIDPEITLFFFLKNKSSDEIQANLFLKFIQQLIEELDGMTLAQLDKIQRNPAMRISLVKTTCKKNRIPLDKDWFKIVDDYDDFGQNSNFIWHMTLLKKMIPVKVLLENDIKIRVFGSNWETIPMFKNVAMGIAKNGAELNRIYNESCINLNTSPSTTYHMKAPEVIAGNNFMLSRRLLKQYDNMPIDFFFEIDKEIVLFDDENDLVEKVKYFLDNPRERETIANAAYNKFISTLTIEKTAQRVLDCLIGLERWGSLIKKAAQIRHRILEMAHWSRSPHVGSCLSIVDILTYVYFNVLEFDIGIPDSPNRDYFILSKGHGAMALYAVLAQRGILPEKMIDGYMIDGGTLPAHLDRFSAPGIEVSAGSLGHGLSMGLGIAHGLKMKNKNNKVLILMGDGETQEGSVWEAAMAAPMLGLDNLIAMIDYNNLQGYGRPTEISAFEPVAEKWAAFGWAVIEADGHNFNSIEQAFAKAEKASRPCMIVFRTTKGKGVSFMEDELKWHYFVMTDERLKRAKEELSDA